MTQNLSLFQCLYIVTQISTKQDIFNEWQLQIGCWWLTDQLASNGFWSHAEQSKQNTVLLLEANMRS